MGLLIKLGLLLLILLVISGYLLYLKIFGKLKGIVTQAVVAAQPTEVHLIRDREVEWKDRQAVATQAQALRAAGFRTITVYRIDEVEDVRLVALAHPEKGWGAVVYEHDEAGVWTDVVAEYPDGGSLTASNVTQGGQLAQPPEFDKIYLKKASVRRLVRAFEKHLGDKPITPVGAADFAEFFRRSWARETTWRQSQTTAGEAETLERDPELDARCEPLFAAIAAGDSESLQPQLGSGIEPEGRDARGRTPLIAAAARGDLAMAQALLTAGADADARAPGNPGQAAMERRASIATMADDIDDPEARKFMKGFGQLVDGGETPTVLNVTALTAAIETGNTELVGALIHAGADLVGRGDLTPLQFAAQVGDPDVVRALLDGGAPPDQPGEDGWTPLMSASFEGFADVVRVLLDGGADPDWKSGRETAITIAAESGYREIVDMLSPLTRAKFVKKAEKLMDEDWEARVDPAAKRLMAAASNGVTPMVEKLLAAGVLADATENEDDEEDDPVTPLMMAAQGGHAATLRALLAAGADVNRDGGAPLAHAAGPAMFMDPADQPATLRLLLDAGASVELLPDELRPKVVEIMANA